MTDYPPIDRLVPHRRPMQLVDRVIAEEGEITRAEHTIGPDHVFLVPGKGVPTYAGFEMMAQSICATDGLKRWRSDRPAALGFLLGCRKFPASRDWLQVGETLTIESRSCWKARRPATNAGCSTLLARKSPPPWSTSSSPPTSPSI